MYKWTISNFIFFYIKKNTFDYKNHLNQFVISWYFQTIYFFCNFRLDFLNGFFLFFQGFYLIFSIFFISLFMNFPLKFRRSCLKMGGQEKVERVKVYRKEYGQILCKTTHIVNEHAKPQPTLVVFLKYWWGNLMLQSV